MDETASVEPERWKVAGTEFLRRPVEDAPAHINVCFVDRDGGELVAARRRKWRWDDGSGKALSFEPTHWTIALGADMPTLATRRPRKRKPAMPEVLKERGKDGGSVIKKHGRRFPAPEIDVISTDRGWQFGSPYRSTDEEEWWRLLGEAFGTRTKTVIVKFVEDIARLVGTRYDPDEKANLPAQHEMQAALSIAAALKPKNEAEAAQAAQAVAVHLAAMKVGGTIGREINVDPRHANALSNLVKAYSGVMDSMAKGRSKKTSKQTIKVTKEITYNDNRDQRQVHIREGGCPGDNQADGADENTRARANPPERGTGDIAQCPTLSSPPQVRPVLQSPSDEGEAGVQEPRRSKSGSAQG